MPVSLVRCRTSNLFRAALIRISAKNKEESLNPNRIFSQFVGLVS
jgi:hypothetical protein